MHSGDQRHEAHPLSAAPRSDDSDEGQPSALPAIVPRAEHGISRANISANALKVLYRLRSAGYQAHLVGGGVRDLLLGREPKDFDVATDARPEQVRELFRNCRLIGRRFRLAHVHFGEEIIEVATFRAQVNLDESDESDDVVMENGRILRDNVYGTIDQDAWRRDFTINALYYDISDFSLRDYAGGLTDIRSGVIRLLGDPDTRYREDPVRLLRAVRFAAKLGFRIEPATEAPLFQLGDLLADVPPARLFEEALKLFMTGHAVQTFELLRRYALFAWLFPETEAALAKEEQGFPMTFLVRALQNTDQRVLEGKPVTPAFLFAALLWEPVRQLAEEMAEEDAVDPGDLREAADEILEIQRQRIAVPKRFALPMREIWELQPRFHRRGGKRVFRLLAHPRFRAAYDFMCLRAESGEELGEVCEWWTAFQSAGATEQRNMAEVKNTRRRRRRRPARKRVESHADDITPSQS